jgi:glycosyltransferase involved in cell wall biosynthesis
MMDLLATVPYYTAYLTKALLARGVDLKLGSISYYLDLSCFSDRGIAVNPGCLDLVSKFALPRSLRRPLKLAEALINHFVLMVRFLFAPPDVLHVQFLPMLTSKLPFDLWFVLWCRKRGIKIVLTVHDLLPHGTGQTHKAKFLNLYHSVDWIICHSDYIRESLAVQFLTKRERISVIPHGPIFYDLLPLATENCLAAGNDGLGACVLWQGIIHPYKGVDLLLEAWQKVEALENAHQLIVAGTGPVDQMQRIRQQVKSLNLKNVILKFDFISTSELMQLYRDADIVVYPYRAVTTSGALATGLALGKAIIASDIPVFREILIDHGNALLADLQRPDDLANALVDLVQNPLLRERLVRGVQDMKFGEGAWISIAEKTVETYRQAIA